MKVVKATIKKQVKGGYLLETENGKNAFMPNSLSRRSRSPFRIHESLDIGTEIYVIVVKDKASNYSNCIVSRKHYLEQLPFDMPKNEPTKGIIAAIQGYGIFVDVGQSIDGFIHANDLPQPSESYKKGTEVTVKLVECNDKGPVFELVNA